MADGTHECCSRSWIDGCACPPDPEEKTGFRAIKPTSPAHAAVLEDLARRIDDE